MRSYALERATYPLGPAESEEDHSSMSGGGNPYPGIGMLPSPDIGVIGVPDGGVKPGGVTLPLFADAVAFSPTIVPSSGHVPLPCPQTPLLSPDVET